MSTVNLAKVQVGQSGTASQNFTALQGNDGTFSITRGNAGAPISVPFKINADNSIDGNMGVGANQTWQNMTGSRALGTTYTNSTGKPIAIHVSCILPNNLSAVQVFVAGVQAGYAQGAVAAGVAYGAGAAVVPDGATYSVTTVGGSPSIQYWSELR